MQLSLIDAMPSRPSGQLLKWIGNKFKYAGDITPFFPSEYGKYIEPFVGTGAILATLSPAAAIAGDTLTPLIELWQLLKKNPRKLTGYYTEVISQFNRDRQNVYDRIKDQYNANPNPLDLLILSRTCYGGVMRFTMKGEISTPIGPHKPISPKVFAARAFEWQARVQNTTFLNQPFDKTMELAEAGDLIYCDPPYLDSQAILYGAQSFKFEHLIEMIAECKRKGARIALSIDGKKKSGKKNIDLRIPAGVFEGEMYLDCGSSMLRRFQNGGQVMTGENVHDRLLLSW